VIDNTRRLLLPRGLPGFEQMREATLTPLGGPGVGEVYAELSDASGDPVRFLLADPAAFFAGYTFPLPEADQEALGLTDPAQARVWVVLTATEQGFLANLRGPVVENPATGRAVQVVLDDTFPLAAPVAG
jgi:flagellar assembly factor FliW